MSWFIIMIGVAMLLIALGIFIGTLPLKMNNYDIIGSIIFNTGFVCGGIILFIFDVCAFINGAINNETLVVIFCPVVLLISLACTVVPINQIVQNIAILKGEATRNDSVWWEED